MNATARAESVRSISTEALRHVEPHRESLNVTAHFARNVFSDAVQRQRLPRPIYKALRRTIETGATLDPSIADTVANAMKDWAIELGATHFTHWFQPMTGLTAEKHDSFLNCSPEGRAMLEFSGRELIKGEPDASSFPSGGLRATFEARGYTAWDPTSPAFVRSYPSGGTLTIPTAFASWTGEALDKKTPLLRSCEALSRQATRLLNLLGESEVESVFPTAGSEQEYFLIDRQFYFQRPDLLACGRTLLGAAPPKGQELEDHYFGAISQRTINFMMELERELWALGVPIKTRHNEVAPSQFELAPIFEHISVATDHNMLTMEVLKELAERHGLHCLLHEKPFAGVNGSGKHLNWSMSDDQGNNLLEPGSTPHDNLKFMLFLTAILRAVDKHQGLLRATIATPGNDHRLGANEAPPAIMSVFVGSQLEEVLQSLVEGRAPNTSGVAHEMRLGVNTLPPLPKDISDRNRTSPFAFTGNKFEFRAVGAGQSIAYPGMVLNTIVAESLDFIATELERRSGTGDRRETIQGLVREVLKQHQRILFSGDNYSSDWVVEAERRGLANLRDTPRALASFIKPEAVKVFESYGVLNQRETASRHEVLNSTYAHRVAVEARSMCDMARTLILPAALGYQRNVAESIAATQQVAADADLDAQKEVLKDLSGRISGLTKAIDAVRNATAKAEEIEDSARLAERFCDDVLPRMNELREVLDGLERLVDDELWPLPKYREMLFVH